VHFWSVRGKTLRGEPNGGPILYGNDTATPMVLLPGSVNTFLIMFSAYISFCSYMPLSTLTLDMFLVVFTHNDLHSLLALSQMCTTLCHLVQCFLLAEWNSYLGCSFLPPVETRCLMHKNNIIVSGSTALHFISHNSPSFSSWTSNDIHFYCPKSHATDLLNFIVLHGYTIILELEDYPTKYPIYLLPSMCSHIHKKLYAKHISPHCLPGISKVIHLKHTSNKALDIIISNSENSLSAITHFWGTLVQNYITADSFTVAYPRTTLYGIAYISPWCVNRGNTPQCKAKYHDHGFDIQHYIAQPNTLYCPQAPRSLQDSQSLAFCFTNNIQPLCHVEEYWQLFPTCVCQYEQRVCFYFQYKWIKYLLISIHHLKVLSMQALTFLNNKMLKSLPTFFSF